MTTTIQPSTRLPPLNSGDRLSRLEFEQRYEQMPASKKYELIEGVVYMASPLRYESHGKPHGYIISWLGAYCAATPGVELADNTTVRLDLDNEPQPDVILRLLPERGGKSWISEDDYVEGVPELIVEIAASSAAYDLHDKFRVYRRNGVPEYLVWQVYEQQLDWFRFQADTYIRLNPDARGILHSQIFPGLRLAVKPLLRGQLAHVLAEL
jgi:Uma2 family endonuclease